MHQFDTPAAISAVLDIPAGRIEVIAVDRTDTTVEVLPTSPNKPRDVSAAEQTTVSYADGILRIAAPKSGNQVLGPSGSVTVTVNLPVGSHLDGSSAAAEFRAVGPLGDVRFDGACGHTKLDEAASVRLTALDGDVEVGRLGGSAQITTAQGDIRIHEAVHGTVVVETQSGDISVGAAAGVSAALDSRTSYGRVTNTLKNDGTSELDIRATTSRGDITAHSL